MIGALRSMSKNQKEAVVDIIVIVACAAFLAGWLGCGIVKGKAEEAGFREKIQFCHDRLKSEKVRYVWRQEYCKGLDAVDPVSGRPVSGVIEGE